MPRLPTLTRRAARPLAVAAVAVTALLATTACQPGEQAAATVNGHQISAATIRSNLDDLNTAAKRSSSPDQFAGAGQDTYQVEVADSLLTLHILTEIISQDLSRRGVKVTAADRTAGEAEVCTDPNSGQSTPGCLDQDPKDLKALRLDLAGQLQALGRTGAAKVPALTAAQLDQQARAQFDQVVAQNPQALDQVCGTLAVVPDAATGTAIKQQVEAGGDFVTVASPLASQPVEPQEQCASASQYPDLAAAQVGQVAGPVTAQGGIFVFQVTRRNTLTYDDVKSTLEQQVQAAVSQQQATARNQAGSTAVRKLLAKADVQVNPVYGRWDPRTGRVVPPKVPKGAATTTTLPAAGSSGGSTSTGG